MDTPLSRPVDVVNQVVTKTEECEEELQLPSTVTEYVDEPYHEGQKVFYPFRPLDKPATRRSARLKAKAA